MKLKPNRNDRGLIDSELMKAYLETNYIVFDAPRFTLRVNQRSERLVELYLSHGLGCGTFITACNPRSVPLSDDENGERQDRLRRDILALELPILDGIGEHPENGWPGEPSFLILGIQLDEARAIGMRHDQNALLWCAIDAIPRLILLR